MQTKPILVILPTHQPKNYLNECIESLKFQTLSCLLYDILVIHNGAEEPYYTDFIKNFTGENVLYQYLEESSVSNARNFGIEYAHEHKYKYVTFIDDDDVVSKNYLKELYEVCESGYDLAISNVLYFSTNIMLATEGNYSFAFKRGVSTSLYKNRKFFSPVCMKMLSLKSIGSCRFPLIPYGEDSIFFTLISNQIQTLAITSDKAIYYIRERGQSISKQRRSFIQRITYYSKLLKGFYFPFLVSGKYDQKFILSRIAAQLKHILL